MKTELERRFIRKSIEDTRCPELIRPAAVAGDVVYLLRERIDCGQWEHVSEYFVPIAGKHIVVEPVAARKYLTTEPERVVAAMKSRGLW